MRSSRRLYKKSIFILAVRSVSVPVRFLLNWLGAFLYGAVVMGAFSITRFFLDILVVVAGLGGDKVMIRFLAHSSIDKNKFRKMFSALFVLYAFTAFLFATFVFFSSGIIASIYQKMWLVPFLKLTAITLPFLVLLIFVNQAFKAINKPLIATIIETTAYNALVLFFITIFAFYIKGHYKIFGFHIGFWFGTLSVFVIALWILHKNLNYRFLSIKDGINYWLGKSGKDNIQKFLRVALPIFIISVSYLYLMNIDRIFLPKFVDGTNLGVYYIAGRVAGLLQIIGIGLLAITPAIIVKKLKRRGQKSAINFIFRMSLLAFILSLFALGVLILVVPFLLSLFGQVYGSALSYINYMLIGTLIFNIGIIAGQGVVLLDKQNLLMKNLLLGVVVATISGWFLTSHFGIIGGVWLFILAQAIISISNWLALLSGHGAIG